MRIDFILFYILQNFAYCSIKLLSGTDYKFEALQWMQII